MAIACPYCGSVIQLKEPKPGRYQPKCPKCAKRFSLKVSDNPSVAPIAAALPESSAAETETIAKPAAGATAPALAAAARPTSGEAPTMAPQAAAGALAETQLPPAANDAPTQATAAFSPGGPAELDATTAPASAGSQQPAGGDATTGFSLASDVGTSRLDDVPATLGGYQMVKELGRGGMGAVYLARQMSLDRNVAVKVMRPEWAKDPIFVARFTREAYAAAQLNHHNVVQIHDIGAQRDTNFFSMEFVEGQSLADLLKREGKLDAEVAVGYVLQAARGLAFAHEQGMVHRDIKPDNLLLSRHGIIKVADLGIVKTPGAPEKTVVGAAGAAAPSQVNPSAPTVATMVGVAMGTPAYMAPEQARDAAHVDARADIYSLGCTLYALVTGRAPFAGKTAAEVMTKHATEPVPPPDVVVKRVPKALSEIILKMVAKAPEDRYQSMLEAAKAMEQFLGVESSGPFSPREEHAETLEQAVAQFNACPAAQVRSKLLLGGGALLGLVALALVFVSPAWAGAALGLAVLTAASYFVLDGITQKTPLFVKARQLAFGASWSDWAMAAIGGILLLVLLSMFGWLWIWLGVLVLAVLLAAGVSFGLDRKIAADRREPLDQVERMLKSMRLQGLEEDALRHFVCKYSGQQWEAFYEALLGYEAKITARERWGQGERGAARPRHRAWRDPLIRWIDARQEARRQRRERKHLQAVEEKGFQAAGLDAAQARRKAEQAAAALVSKAARTRKAPVQAAPEESGSSASAWVAGLVGGKMRFAAGALLLTGSLLWMHQNGMLTERNLKALKTEATKAVESQDFKKLTDVDQLKEKLPDLSKLQKLKPDVKLADLKAKLDGAGKSRKPLALPLAPGWLVRPFGSFSAGLAGLLLLASAMMSGRKVALVVLLAGAAFAGQFIGLP